MNLLNETINILKKYNLDTKDVIWVGNYDLKTDWDNFAKISDVNYDSGFGSQEVATDLIIVGKDWWLERHEYDGSEWWEFKQLPKEPETKVILSTVVSDGWSNI